MIKALRSSSLAMSVQQQRHELIANNLANANTPGFQKLFGRVRAEGGGGTTDKSPGGPVHGLLVESLPSQAQGSLVSTGNPLDAAIMGEGFFLVETPEGQRLTRDGAFGLGPEGELLHSSGHPVLAGGSSIFIRSEPSIMPDGTVMDGDRAIARLSVVTPNEGSGLIRRGDNLIEAPGGFEEQEAGESRILGGHLEGSNVEAVEEMVSMIRAFRAYEMATKAAQAADDTLRTAVTRVGVLRA
jgi:flagellar basal-body rod protein FlgF